MLEAARAVRLTSSSLMKILLLGSFQIHGEKGPVLLAARKAQSLLAFLVLHPTKQPREKLAALFWGDSSDTLARHSLRTALKNLRQQLDPDLLLADRETVQLNPEFPLWVDVLEFQMNATTAPISAIALYRGDLMADFYDEWIVPDRAQFRELYLVALERLTQTHRTAGEYERAMEFARQLLAADLTNERAHQHLMFCQLALGNRSAALQQYQECERALQTELAVAPSRETTALYKWIEQASSERPSAAAQITNLPIPLSSFIGRKRQLAELKNEISATRLLTLSGAGGSGKTRLTIHVATDLIDQFHDGVWWVELAPLFDEKLVPQAVAQVLGGRDVSPGLDNRSLVELLQNVLREKQLLLVLDNCEHLIVACAQLADALLTHCPKLRILATSREPMGITGEQVYQVPTLSLPTTERLTLADLLLDYESIRLFVERARQVNTVFRLTDENAAAVFEICRRLDGIPLAIELAAARMSLLSVQEIASRLNDRFNLLTHGSRAAMPRQQTLRATVDWSYDLLSDESRVLFRRLSVFVGGFTLQAAEQVCSAEPLTPGVILEQLARLVDRSLVKVEQQGKFARYHMLETLREYAHEKHVLCANEGLSTTNEMERLRERHCDFFIALAEEAEPKLAGREELDWLERLHLELDNVRAALAWALEKGAIEKGLRLAAALLWFWDHTGYLAEASAWLERFLNASPDDVGAARAKGLIAAGTLVRPLGDVLGSVKWLNEGLKLYRELGDERGIAQALQELGFTAYLQGEREKGIALLQQSLELARAARDRIQIGDILLKLATAQIWNGELDAAEAHYQEALQIHREVGGRFDLSWALGGLGDIARRQGKYELAFERFKEALQVHSEIEMAGDIAYTYEALANLMAQTGQPARAARLWGAGEAVRSERKEPLAPPFAADYAPYLDMVREQLGTESFEAEWQRGRALTLEEAIEYALEQTKSKTLG